MALTCFDFVNFGGRAFSGSQCQREIDTFECLSNVTVLLNLFNQLWKIENKDKFQIQKLQLDILLVFKSTIDSARFFDAAYPNCEFVQDNLHEVFSLFEQEICSRGSVFIYSTSSSWSGSIRRER